MTEDGILVALITLMGVVITALVTWSIAQRRIAVEHVTAERTKWRKEVRMLALQVHDSILQPDEVSLGRLRSEFATLLNPFHREDREILERITEDESRQGPEERANEFTRRISLLLKHDWDRAKLEAGFFLPRWTLKAKRHGLGCDEGEGCTCRGENGLPWSDKYEVRPVPALVLAVGLLVTLCIIACVLCHCFGPSVTKDTSIQVLLDAGMVDGEKHDSL